MDDKEREYEFFKRIVAETYKIVSRMEEEKIITPSMGMATFQEILRRKLQ